MPGALFLDRDGVINVDHGYVFRRDDFEWRDGIFELVRAASTAGMPTIIVTNQSGIARGYYTEHDFSTLTRWMLDEFARRDAPIAAVYHCPFMDGAELPQYAEDRLGWRKPKPGMLLQAKRDHAVDMAASAMVGDQWSDAQAARAAGVGRVIIVGEPRGKRPPDLAEVERVPDVRAAIDAIFGARPM